MFAAASRQSSHWRARAALLDTIAEATRAMSNDGNTVDVTLATASNDDD